MRSIRLIAIGLNHKTAPVEVRERFSLNKEQIITALDRLHDYEPLQEAVIVSTCNRSEFYFATESNEAIAVAQRFMADVTGNSDFESFANYTYTFLDDACVYHLFQVASSLDSLVLGEGQILSQVKHAYMISKDNGTTSTALNLMFHRAIATGKRVRSETKIAYNAVSVSYAAVELAKDIFDDFGHCSILLIGAGQMAELTATHFISQGAKNILVANRHKERAVELAKRFAGEAISLSEAHDRMSAVDIVVTSTGAPHYVIRTDALEEVMERRGGRPLILIDIAVPRDVDPAVEEIEGVKLYNIDALEAVVDENLQERKKEAVQAESIVQEEMENLLDKFRYLPFQPMLAKLSDRAEVIRSREIKRVMSKLPKMSDSEQRALEHMTRMIVRKILREPMSKVTDSAGKPYEEFMVRAMDSLFELGVR